ncbi:hypothetical protein GE09DRAFT_590058 [Coniochaeta sp. 2T2.1]|nr:hypothetical protein GE09DRAFT_590058 [Coniochaeta sp. 2T2.1]
MPNLYQIVRQHAPNGTPDHRTDDSTGYELNLIQMLFHTGTDIALRLDKGSIVAERLAGIGLPVAALAGLTSPLALIIGFFGMNVQEFTEGASKTLFDFWQVALPIMVASVGGLSIILIRSISGTKN